MIKLKIPVNKTEELVIVSNEGMVNIEKYKGDQRIEVQLEDIAAIIDTIVYLDKVQWSMDKECRNKPIPFYHQPPFQPCRFGRRQKVLAFCCNRDWRLVLHFDCRLQG